MGKKAVKYFFYNLTIPGTVVLLLLAIGALRASHINPAESDTYFFLGLMLPVILFLNLAALVYWIVLRKWWALIPLAALLLHTGTIAAVYRVRFGSLPDGKPDLKVASYNIHGFRQGDYRTVVGQIAGLMREEGADVVCLQEFVPDLKFPPDSVFALFSFLPYTIHEREQLFLSRYPIRGHRFFPFEKTDNSALLTEIDLDGKPVHILSVHLQTTGVSPAKRMFHKEMETGNLNGGMTAVSKMRHDLLENAAVRARQVGILRPVLDSLQTPVVVCGDFNDTQASYTYRALKGDMTDAFISAGRGYGATYRNIRNTLRIDYIFYNGAIEGISFFSPDVDYSDHRPVIAGLKLK